MSASPALAEVSSSRDSLRQYLTFRIDGDDMGIPILTVQEIRGLTPITPVPDMPSHMKGVMNLRGRVIPVFDLRTRFGVQAPTYTKYTVIIIVQLGQRIQGVVVDAVTGVLDVTTLEEMPDGGQHDLVYIEGIARTDERLTILLDLHKLIGGDSQP